MQQSQRLSYRDIRSVTELVGQSVELGRDPTLWRTHALEGLIRLTHGRVGLTTDIEGVHNEQPRMIDPIDVGFDDGARRIFYHDYAHVITEDPGTQALARLHRSTRFGTATRRELIDDREWYSARAVSELRRSGDCDDFVCTSVQIRPNVLQGFIVYRNWGEPPFGIRERRIMRLFHAGLLREYAHARTTTADVPELQTLPPRVRQTLDRIVAGQSLKQIAASLKISRHTVNDYTKVLHKRFGVSSRAELLNLVSKRQGHSIRLPSRVVEIGSTI